MYVSSREGASVPLWRDLENTGPRAGHTKHTPNAHGHSPISCVQEPMADPIKSGKEKRATPGRSPGFTLVELTLVLVLLGVTAAFAARPVAQIMDLWVDTMRSRTDRTEVNYVLERMSREVRQGETDGLCAGKSVTIDGREFDVDCGLENGSLYILKLQGPETEIQTHVYCRGCN